VEGEIPAAQPWNGLPNLNGLRELGACGTSGGAVKCVDIGGNASGESGMLELFLTLRRESQGSERD
jgi:hypothetical protein